MTKLKHPFISFIEIKVWSREAKSREEKRRQEAEKRAKGDTKKITV